MCRLLPRKWVGSYWETGQISPTTGAFWATRDGGKTWYVQSALPVRPIQFIDERNGWGYIWWRINPSTIPTPKESHTICQCLVVTHDGGQSWQKLPAPPKYFQYFKFVNEHMGWGLTGTIGDQGWEAGLFRTMDGGISWQEATLPSEIASSAVNSLAAIDERTAWLSFYRMALTTVDIVLGLVVMWLFFLWFRAARQLIATPSAAHVCVFATTVLKRRTTK